MESVIQFSLIFEGEDADFNEIDFYDVSQSLIGFQRSIALTTHLILNGEIITQAPSLKGARILANPAAEGSWKITATVLAGLYAVGTAPKDTPLGHIVRSAYDYVVSESLGVHVDYEKSLGQIIEQKNIESKLKKNIQQTKLDSLVEKCSTALSDIHRPIYKTGTASRANIKASTGSDWLSVGPGFSIETFYYMTETYTAEKPDVISGIISSYNSNTYKGRIFVVSEGRPVSFELSENCRSNSIIKLVTASLTANALRNLDDSGAFIYCKVYKNTTKSGHLKSYKIIEISHNVIV